MTGYDANPLLYTDADTDVLYLPASGPPELDWNPSDLMIDLNTNLWAEGTLYTSGFLKRDKSWFVRAHKSSLNVFTSADADSPKYTCALEACVVSLNQAQRGPQVHVCAGDFDMMFFAATPEITIKWLRAIANAVAAAQMIARCEMANQPPDGVVLALLRKPADDVELLSIKHRFLSSAIFSLGSAIQYWSISALELVDVSLTVEGLSALVSFMTKSQTLSRVDISQNPLGDSAGALLGTMLEQNSSLRYLYLADCSLSDCGFEDLFEGVLRHPGGLLDLDVSRNGITDQGLAIMLDVIEDFEVDHKDPQPQIGTLILDHNLLSIDGCVALSRALRSRFFHLSHLSMKHCCNDSEATVELLSGFRRSARLKTVDLTGVAITCQTLTDLIELFGFHGSLSSISVSIGSSTALADTVSRPVIVTSLVPTTIMFSPSHVAYSAAEDCKTDPMIDSQLTELLSLDR